MQLRLTANVTSLRKSAGQLHGASSCVASAAPQRTVQSHAVASRRTIASVLLVAPLFVAGGAHAKDAAELAKEKAARKQALKEKAKKTQESGEAFEGEEFGKNYEPPKSETIIPGFLKNI